MTGIWFRGGAVLALLGTMAAAGSGQAPGAAMLGRSATIVLKVPDFDAARQRVLDAARARGAQLMDAKTAVNEKGKKHGWVRLRLSADRLPGLLPALGGAGKLYSENVQTADHVSEYEELARRVTRLQQHEGRLSGVLQSPRRMRGSDVLYLQERLFRASVDESLLSQQRLDLERSAQVSTVLVDLFEPGTMPAEQATGPVNLGQRFVGAANLARAGLNHQAARGATALAYAFVYAPLWLPVLLLALVALRLLWVHRRRVVAWLMAMLTRLLGLLAVGVAWLRAAWDARHERIGFARPTEDDHGGRTAPEPGTAAPVTWQKARDVL